MMLSAFVINLLNEWQIEDLPINVLIDGKYYDISSFYFDKEVNEYMLEIDHPIDYDTRSCVIKVKKGD